MNILNLEDIISEVRKFKNLKNGWDGYGSIAPTYKKIDSAVQILKNWPLELGSPTIEPDIDGNIIMEVIDDESNEMISIDIVGAEVAFFSIIRGVSIIYQKKFNINDLSNQLKISKNDSENVYPRL